MKTEIIYFKDRSYLEVDSQVYKRAVRKMEKEGLTTSDAQGTVDAQILGKFRTMINKLIANQSETLLGLQEVLKLAEDRSYPVKSIEESFKAVCSQNCTPRDLSNLEIFLNTFLVVEDSLDENEVSQIINLKKSLNRMLNSSKEWKTIF